MLSKRYRVLVVDDSAFMRMILTKILTSEGSLEVIDTAADGEEAVRKVASSDRT